MIPKLHEQMVCVLGFHSMIVGQLEVSVNVSFHLCVVFRPSMNPHLHRHVGIFNASPNATGLDNPLVAAARTC